MDFNNDLVITDEGRVGIGTTNPELEFLESILPLKVKLKLDVRGTVSIARNIYDSAESPGVNGAYLNRDEHGIRWVTFNTSIY